MNAQVPAEFAHLQAFYKAGVPDLGQAATAGINTFSHNRISIRAGRWRLVDPQGVEQVLEQFHVDVIFVDANPNNSKLFYPGGYDPDESVAPTCWSDNGVAPSDRVSVPQCVSCAACPMNVIGSRITPNNKAVKACSDSRRLAVIMADNPTGPIYELRVPPASLKNMANAFKSFNSRGIKIETMVWRLTFDTTAEFPQIIFNPASWITPEHVPVVQRLLGSQESATIVGRDDKPRTAALPAPAAPVAAIAPPPAATVAAPAAPAFTTPSAAAPIVAATPVAGPVMPAAAPAFNPAAAAPAAVAPAAAPKPRKKKQPEVPGGPMVSPPAAAAPAAFNPPAAPAPAFNPAPAAPAAPAFNPAGFNAQPAASAAPVAAAPAYAPPPAFLQQPRADVPNAVPPAAAVSTAPTGTDAELDSILGGMKLS
jgi:hypothetical protein